jgi:multidrug efflux pump subunit AcrA (membrane-fusion protein)
MSPSVQARSTQARSTVLRRTAWLAGASTLVALALVTVRPWQAQGKSPIAAGGAFHTVVPMDIELKVVRDGDLQAVNNIELVSQVEGSATIQFIVKEGAAVKKGDTLVQLDSAAIRQRIEDTTLELQKAEADVTTSRELLEIQKSQNATNAEAAEVQLAVARLDLKQYAEGTYPQAVKTVENKLEMAKIDLLNKQADFEQVKKLAAKGYLTATDVKTREIDLIRARNTLGETENELRVLTEFKNERDLTQFRSALAQAEQRAVRVYRENTANLAQRQADLGAKTQALAFKERQLERLKEQFTACTIIAPTDGMVVYATSGDRNAQQAIQEGSQVRERQAILRLPDTSSMKAVIRVPEAQVGRLREGLKANITVANYKQPLSATLAKISPLADNSQRWWNPDVREFPVDLYLDETPPNFRPGMGAVSEIIIARHEGVLAVPLTTLYTVGRQSFVFIRDGNDLKPAEVKLGDVNETHAILLEGVRQGDEVRILQAGEGRAILDAAVQAGEVKLAPPATRPSGAPGGRTDGERRRPGPSGATAPQITPPAPTSTQQPTATPTTPSPSPTVTAK